jgi:hypothetical protein
MQTAIRGPSRRVDTDPGPSDHVGRRKTRFVLCLLMGFSWFAEACGDRALQIPNSISDEEYSVYSAWIKHYFKEQPPHLLLASRTFIFDPIIHGSCDVKTLQAEGHVSFVFLQQLHDLGEAEFPVHVGKFELPQFKIPWKYEESEGLFMHPSPPFRLIAFSRVVFNQNRSEGFFAVSNSCGGLCGGGGPLIVARKNGQWVFRSNLGCFWVY